MFSFGLTCRHWAHRRCIVVGIRLARQGGGWIVNAMVSCKQGSGGEIEGPKDIPEKDGWVGVAMFVLLLSRYGICAERAVEDGGIVDVEGRGIVTCDIVNICKGACGCAGGTTLLGVLNCQWCVVHSSLLRDCVACVAVPLLGSVLLLVYPPRGRAVEPPTYLGSQRKFLVVGEGTICRTPTLA